MLCSAEIVSSKSYARRRRCSKLGTREAKKQRIRQRDQEGEELVPAMIKTTHKTIKLTVTTLLVIASVAAATPDSAEATPVYSTCYPGDEVGYYEWYDDGQGNFTDSIGINDCALDSMGAGLEDREKVLEHELGHAQGYGHSDDPYDLMYPQMLLTGY
jgi:Matrixin